MYFLPLFCFAVIGVILMLVFSVIVLAAAFTENASQGLLCLFVPGYSVYYLFARQPKRTKPAAMIFLFSGLGILAAVIALVIVGFAFMASG